MVSCVFRLLFLSSVFASVFCDSPEVELVKNLISRSKEYFRDNNLTETAIPDTSWFFKFIQFHQGRFGRFDTVELQPDPEIKSHNNHYGTVYNYNFRTGLRNLTISYQFHVNIPFFAKYGNVNISVGEKSFQLEGRLLVKRDGTCVATLQDAKVVQLGDFKIKFEPDNSPFLTKLYQAILNVIHKQIIPIINRTIRKEIDKPYFKEKFTEMSCAEVTRNSKGRTPTVN